MKLLLFSLLFTPALQGSAAADKPEKDTVIIVSPDGHKVTVPRAFIKNRNISNVWATTLEVDPELKEIPVPKRLGDEAFWAFMEAAKIMAANKDVAQWGEQVPPDVLEQYAKELRPNLLPATLDFYRDVIYVAHTLDSPVIERAFIQEYLDKNPTVAQMNEFIDPIREQFARYLFLKNPDAPFDERLGFQKPVTIPFYLLMMYGFIPEPLLKRIPVQKIMKDSNFIFSIGTRNGPLLVQLVLSRRGTADVVRALRGVLRLPGINLDMQDSRALRRALVSNDFDRVELLLNAGARISDQLLAQAHRMVDQKQLSPQILDLLQIFAQSPRPATPPKSKSKVIYYGQSTPAQTATTSHTAATAAASAAADDKSSKDSKHLKK